MERLTCLDCEWTGKSDELVSRTEELNDHDYYYCPNCGGKEFNWNDQPGLALQSYKGFLDAAKIEVYDDDGEFVALV